MKIKPLWQLHQDYGLDHGRLVSLIPLFAAMTLLPLRVWLAKLVRLLFNTVHQLAVSRAKKILPPGTH